MSMGNGLRNVAAALSLASLAVAGPAAAQEVKIGAVLGLTGGLAAYAPAIVDAAQLAVKHVNDNGGVLDGRQLRLMVVDDQTNPQVSVDAARRLVSAEGVVAIIGPLGSGQVLAVAPSVTIPNGVPHLAPTATSPKLTTLDDKDFVFRTCPSDAFIGQTAARYLVKRGIKVLALTYMNNDYGKGLASSFRDEFVKLGGKITADLEHNEKAASFRSELATLAKDKPPYLFVIGYANSSGPIILKQALEGGFFKKFIGSEGTRDVKVYQQIGIKNLEGNIMLVGGDPSSKALDLFNAELTKINKEFVGKPYVAHSYDAAFMLALAVEIAGGTDRTKVRDALRRVGSIGGVAIGPGEWKKAKDAIAKKQKVTYHGAAGNHVFSKEGDVSGVVDVYEIKAGKEVKTITLRN
jgi:branched-chain amino acid transport system substrate-binding protein